MFNDKRSMYSDRIRGQQQYKFRVGSKPRLGMTCADVLAWIGLLTIIVIVLIEIAW